MLIKMNSSNQSSNYGHQATTEVSESAFEYLLGEILQMKPVIHEDSSLLTPSDMDFLICQRLDEMGFNIGYR